MSTTGPKTTAGYFFRAPGTDGPSVLDVLSGGPDGYSLGLTPSSTVTLAHLFQDIPSDLLERTEGLLLAARQRIGMAVKTDSPIASMNDFLHEALPHYVHLGRRNIRVVLIHPGEYILPELGEELVLQRGGLPLRERLQRAARHVGEGALAEVRHDRAFFYRAFHLEEVLP